MGHVEGDILSHYDEIGPSTARLKNVASFVHSWLFEVSGNSMMSLDDLIDEALGFLRNVKYVEPCRHWMTREECEEFSNLALQLYLEAKLLNLCDMLPQVNKLQATLSSDEALLPSPVFETMLNLPGNWDYLHNNQYRQWCDEPLVATTPGDQPTDPPKKVFFFILVGQWLRDMEELKKISNELPAGWLHRNTSSEEWMTQAEVQRALRYNYSIEVSRLCDQGKLVTNGKTHKAKRINKSSLFNYADKYGLELNFST